jgi:hypothetical protein
VFTTPIGSPVDPRNDYREFKQLAEDVSNDHWDGQ